MPCWFEENINLRRKGRTDKEKKENVWPTEEKKNRKEKKQIFGQRKYLVHGGEKERRRKRRKIFEEKKCLVHRAETEQRRKRRKIFGLRRRKRTENIWSAEEMKNGEGKGGNYSEEEN